VRSYILTYTYILAYIHTYIYGSGLSDESTHTAWIQAPRFCRYIHTYIHTYMAVACLMNLRTLPGSKRLDSVAQRAGRGSGSEAKTVKEAYFCEKYRAHLLEGITR
jgi:hypothetical protein